MTRHVVLDSAALSAVSSPTQGTDQVAVSKWITQLQAAGHKIYIAEVIDYELRRELIRAGKTSSVLILDGLKKRFRYTKITTEAMLLAADLWAAARRGGFATAHPERLDVDVILAAQALLLPVPPGSLIVATSNVRHLSRFVAADEWQNIHP